MPGNLYPANQRVVGERRIGRGPRDAAAGDHRHDLWVPIEEVYAAYDTSTDETTIGTMNVQPGEFRLGDSIVIRHLGDLQNFSGGTMTLRVKVKVGANTVFDHTSIALASGQPHRAVRLSSTMTDYYGGGSRVPTTEKQMVNTHLLIGDLGTFGLSGAEATASAIVDEALQSRQITLSLTTTNALTITTTMSVSASGCNYDGWTTFERI